MADQGHIFISYKRGERDFVERLAKSLESDGITIWMDVDREVGITVGDEWTTEIDQALKNSVGFVLVITPDYFESDWCQEEMNIAYMNRLPIFPILLKQTNKEKMPAWLGLRQYIDFQMAQSNEAEYVKQISTLISGIRKNLSKVEDDVPLIGDPFEALEAGVIGKRIETHIKSLWEANAKTNKVSWITAEQMITVMGELALDMMNSLDGGGLPLEDAARRISWRLPRRNRLLPNGKKTVDNFVSQIMHTKIIKRDSIRNPYSMGGEFVDGIRFFQPSYLTYFTAVGLQQHDPEYLSTGKSSRRRYNEFDKRINSNWEQAVITLCGIVDNPDDLINLMLEIDVILSAKCTLSNIEVSQDTFSGVHKALEYKLLNATSERERDFIPEILRLLIQFEGISALPKILTVWGNLHNHHRDKVLDMIVGFGRDAVPALLSALKPENADKPIFVWVIRALGEIGDKRGILPLQNLIEPIDEENDLTQMTICASLGKLGEKEPIEILRKEAFGTPPPYDERDRYSTRQINAWYALADIGIGMFPMMMEIFTEVLQPEENSTVWGQASKISLCFNRTMTQRFGSKAVDNLLSELGNPDNQAEIKSTIIESLSEIQDERAVPHLAQALHHHEFLVRNSATKALSKFKTPTAIDTLIGALMDPDSFIRGEAAETLGKLKATQAIQALTELLDDNELKHDYGERICTIAISALMAIDTKESLDIAAEWCVKHMNDSRPYHYVYATVGAWARQRLEFIEPIYTNELIKRFQQGDDT